MSDFIEGIITVISFICKSVAAALCTVLLLFSIIDIFRWPEWFKSVGRSSKKGFGSYCACCLLSFVALWVDLATIFPSVILLCSWRIGWLFRIFKKHFGTFRAFDSTESFIWNVELRGWIWLNFLMFLGDLPFILFAALTLIVPWRIPSLVHILYVQCAAGGGGSAARGRGGMSYGEFRFNIFFNFILAFWDIATVLLGLLSLLSPLRVVMWGREWRDHKWQMWVLPTKHINYKPRVVMCFAGLLVLPDWFAFLGYIFALPFVWNIKACFAGHVRRARYKNGYPNQGTRLSDEQFEERLFLSPHFFLRGWKYVLIGLMDIGVACLLLPVVVSWRNVRLYRQLQRNWQEEGKEGLKRVSEERRKDEGRKDPYEYEANFETRALIAIQFILLLTDLIFIAMFVVTCLLVIRAYPVCRRINKVRTKPTARGHSARGWYYCNYRIVVGIEFVKTFLIVLALPLVLLLLLTVYRVPVCKAEMAKVRAAWAALQEKLLREAAEKEKDRLLLEERIPASGVEGGKSLTNGGSTTNSGTLHLQEEGAAVVPNPMGRSISSSTNTAACAAANPTEHEGGEAQATTCTAESTCIDGTQPAEQTTDEPTPATALLHNKTDGLPAYPGGSFSSNAVAEANEGSAEKQSTTPAGGAKEVGDPNTNNTCNTNTNNINNGNDNVVVPHSRYVKDRSLPADVYEIDEEEEERALFFSYALVFGTQCALVLLDAFFAPLALWNIITIVRTHRQIREFFWYSEKDGARLGCYRRTSIWFNFLFSFRDVFFTLIVWPLTAVSPFRFISCIVSLVGALGGSGLPKDPVPAIKLMHWSWHEEAGYGWRMKVAGYVDPHGEHAWLLKRGPESVSINIVGDDVWARIECVLGGMKASIGKRMLPITFKGTAQQVRIVEPFPIATTSESASATATTTALSGVGPEGHQPREELAAMSGGDVAIMPHVSSSSPPPRTAPSSNYFAELDCQTSRLKGRALVNFGNKLLGFGDVPLRLVLGIDGNAHTLVDIHTTVRDMLTAHATTGAASLDLGRTLSAHEELIMVNKGDLNGACGTQKTKEVTAESWAPYACDVWWFIVATELAQALLDVAALFCFLFAHLNPLRAVIMYADLFYSLARMKKVTSAGQMRAFIVEYKNLNDASGGKRKGSTARRRHMRLAEEYETHLNNVHKRSITLYASANGYGYGSMSLSRALSGASNAAAASLYSVASIEKSSVGDQLAIFLHEARRAVGDDALDLPSHVRALGCILANNVLALCGVVGDKFFRDMARLLYAEERRGGIGGGDNRDTTVSSELKRKILEYHADNQMSFLTLAPNGTLGLDYTEQIAGQYSYLADPSSNAASARTSLGMRYLHINRGTAHESIPAGDHLVAERLGFPSDVANFMIDQRLSEVLQSKGVDLEVPSWTDGTENDDVGKKKKHQGTWAENYRFDETSANDETLEEREAREAAEAIRAVKKAVHAEALAKLVDSSNVPLPMSELSEAMCSTQESVLKELESSLSAWESEARRMDIGAFNYEFTAARFRCMYHAAMAIADLFTFIALVLVCLPVYRIPTVISYARYMHRHGRGWRWAILMVVGEYMLDCIFLLLYVICVCTLIEAVYVHQRMLYHWYHRPSYWSLREGIVDALADLGHAFSRALKALLRCRTLYYALLTFVLGIVAPIELATNHFGLSRSKWLCFRGWMIAFMGWVVLIVMPFAVVFSPSIVGSPGSVVDYSNSTLDVSNGLLGDTASTTILPASTFSSYLYAYVGIVAAFVFILVAAMLLRTTEKREQIAVSLAFLPVSGATVSSFLLSVLEVAQLVALPIIVSTGARLHNPSGSEGFVFHGNNDAHIINATSSSDSSLSFSWLTSAAHYMYLDHVSRFHLQSGGGEGIVSEPNRYPVGYYLSFSMAVFIFFIVSLPVVVDSLLEKHTGMSRHSLWKGAAFLGNIFALFVVRNLVAWSDCNTHRTFEDFESHNSTVIGGNTTSIYFPMQVGEASLNFACWYQLSSSDRAAGAFTLVLAAFYCLLVVLKGVRFAQENGEVDEGKEELQATFHEVADTYTAVLHLILAATSAFLYTKPLAYCCLFIVILGLFTLIHSKNEPLVKALFPVNRIATLPELNTFRNIGYLSALGTAAVCLAALKSVEGASSLTFDASYVVSDTYPLALIGVWGFCFVLMLAMMGVSRWCPRVFGAEESAGHTQWEALQEEAVAFVEELASGGRLIPTYSTHYGTSSSPTTAATAAYSSAEEEEGFRLLCPCCRGRKRKRSTLLCSSIPPRLANLLSRFETASSLAAFTDAVIELEGAIHIASYTPAFFVSRTAWWSVAVSLSKRGIREGTIAEAENLLQSLRNGCAAGSTFGEGYNYDYAAGGTNRGGEGNGDFAPPSSEDLLNKSSPANREGAASPINTQKAGEGPGNSSSNLSPPRRNRSTNHFGSSSSSSISLSLTDAKHSGAAAVGEKQRTNSDGSLLGDGDGDLRGDQSLGRVGGQADSMELASLPSQGNIEPKKDEAGAPASSSVREVAKGSGRPATAPVTPTGDGERENMADPEFFL